MTGEDEQHYRHCGTGLLRAAAIRPDPSVQDWPELSDTRSCRAWLTRQWTLRPEFAEAVRHASPVLGIRLTAIVSGQDVTPRQVQRATRAAVRYLLRATGRHTPFGLFAGVAPVAIRSSATVSWGHDHRPAARVDNEWLAAVIDYLENNPELLARLAVTFTSLATARGRRLETVRGPSRVTVRYTEAVQAAREIARAPIQFRDLADKLVTTFPPVDAATVERTLTELVKQGFLLTSLRAPLTCADPLAHLVVALDAAEAHHIAPVAEVLVQLKIVLRELQVHNTASPEQRSAVRAGLTNRLDELARELKRRRKQAGLEQMSFGRVPLSLDLRLDVDLGIPEQAVEEMERAASALMRLTRQPTGEPAWRDFYTAFCDRYGTGTLVPICDVVDSDAGLGFPSGYPGSVLPARPDGVAVRDERLLAMAWQAIADDSGEIALDDEIIRSLAVVDVQAQPRIPPHVELAARVHATDLEALGSGNFRITVTPGRSAGTFTSRFASVTEDCGLMDVLRAVPTAVAGALPVQLSFPPVYAHAANICRVPEYLPHVLALGEHRYRSTNAIELDDLAVTATRDGLHLLSLSRQQVIEPQAFHGLNLEKQPPALARFLIHLSRGLTASWTEFDWGPHATRLQYLPRVRYRRAILAPARWRLTTDDLRGAVTDEEWSHALQRWRDRWRCPESVELTDADRTLRLDLDVPAHVAILRAHVELRGHATLTETVDQTTAYGWIGGHAHEIVLPLVTTRPPAKSPITVARPVVTNRAHGQLPGSPKTTWLNVKVHTHPEMIDDLIADYLPALLGTLPDAERAHWFIRYRSPQETDHLRLRIRTRTRAAYAEAIAAVGAWAEQLREQAIAGRLVVDTYCPETGRYGHGPALAAAEKVFVADSTAVAAQLRHLPEQLIHRRALAALNMIATVHGLLGDTEAAIGWLLARRIPGPLAGDRNSLRQAVAFVGKPVPAPPESGAAVTKTWQARTEALEAYRYALPPAQGNTDAVLESLLHMHHNRLIGIDRTSEERCRRLARHTALAWAKQRGDR